MAAAPAGYRFLRIVLIVGGAGFGLLGLFYLASGQYVPGLFAVFVAAIEFAALPLFRRLFDLSRSGAAGDRGENG